MIVKGAATATAAKQWQAVGFGGDEGSGLTSALNHKHPQARACDRSLSRHGLKHLFKTHLFQSVRFLPRVWQEFSPVPEIWIQRWVRQARSGSGELNKFKLGSSEGHVTLPCCLDPSGDLQQDLEVRNSHSSSHQTQTRQPYPWRSQLGFEPGFSEHQTCPLHSSHCLAPETRPTKASHPIRPRAAQPYFPTLKHIL